MVDRREGELGFESGDEGGIGDISLDEGVTVGLKRGVQRLEIDGHDAFGALSAQVSDQPMTDLTVGARDQDRFWLSHRTPAGQMDSGLTNRYYSASRAKRRDDSIFEPAHRATGMAGDRVWRDRSILWATDPAGSGDSQAGHLDFSTPGP